MNAFANDPNRKNEKRGCVTNSLWTIETGRAPSVWLTVNESCRDGGINLAAPVAEVEMSIDEAKRLLKELRRTVKDAENNNRR